MGMFTPYVYTHTTPGKAGFQFGLFVLAVLGLSGGIYMVYPDKPAVPRTYSDNGLERALGGKGALLVRIADTVSRINQALTFLVG